MLVAAAISRRCSSVSPANATTPAPPREQPAIATRVGRSQTEIAPVATARHSEGEPPVPDEDDAEELPSNIAPTPIPAPSSGPKRRGYTIPKEPFILDPLL